MLASPEPLTIADVQAQLRAEEALVLFLDTPGAIWIPQETFIWVITKTEMRWKRSDMGTPSLTREVAALRCGLDRATWESALSCAKLLNIDLDKAPKLGEPVAFELARAHQLYRALFGQVEDIIKGKHLLIVPSGPLTQLPFHVLVTDKPDSTATGNDAFRRAAWFSKSNAITVLPAVSSLKALREYAKTSHATKPFVGFGNPLLDGNPNEPWQVERARKAREWQHCPARAESQRMAAVAGARVGLNPLARGGLADVDDIRLRLPLPETTDELCAVALSLGVSEGEIRLGAKATETEVKALSADGRLANYRVIHFATHGAVSGDINGEAEPGLIMTPPDKATAEDDGYLSASEIAGLKLDADWVILSACNTAAGGAEGAEALSGMSRAFFYAGARTLLVSHWEVYSDATVKLITKTLSTMAADQTIGRSEALRRSMVSLIEQGAPHEAHPAYWAPFVVVGEGSTGKLVPTPVATSSIIPESQTLTKATPSPRPRPAKRVPRPDWRSDIWRP